MPHMTDPNGFSSDPAFTEGGKSGTASPQSHGSSSADVKPALESLLAAPSPSSGDASCPQAAVGSLRFDSPAFLGGTAESQDKGDNGSSSGSEVKDKDSAHSSHSEGAVKRKIKEEPEGGHPNFLGVDQPKGMDPSSSSSSSLSRPSPAKVPSRGKSDSSRPTLQDVITQLAHSAGSQSSCSGSSPSPAILLTPVSNATVVASSVSVGSAKAVKQVNPERVAVKSEESAGSSGSPSNRGDKPAALSSPPDPAHRSHQPAVSPKAAARGRGRERKPKGDNCTPTAVAAHQGSLPLSSPTPQALTSPGLAGMPPRMPLNGAIFPGMPMAYEGSFAYDYNLPDRGLGSAAFAGIPPRFPAMTPNMVGYFAGLGVPVAPWNLSSPTAISAVAIDTASTGKPLDLSASHRDAGDKSTPEKSTGKPCPPAATATSVKSASAVKAKPAKEDKEKAKEKAAEPAAEAPETKAEPPAKKPKYEKHMLIFGEKEVEIICVEKNCWIVRNEQELFDIIRSTSPQPPSLQKRKLSHMTPCDSASGSDCECLRSSISQGGGEGPKKETASVKDDCECVTSSMKRGSAEPSNVPSSSTQKNCGDCTPAEDEPSSGKVSKLKTTATSSTGSLGDSGEDDGSGETPTIPSPSAMKIDSSDSGGDKVKLKCSSMEDVVNLVCDNDEGSSSKCPVLQKMLKTSP